MVKQKKKSFKEVKVKYFIINLVKQSNGLFFLFGHFYFLFFKDFPDDCLRIPGFACMSAIRPAYDEAPLTVNASPEMSPSMIDAPVLFDLNSRLVVGKGNSSFRR
jgi:hypothetical protein